MLINKLGFSVDKTMSIAQKLYEGLDLETQGNPKALITYMRTDSLRIADSALKAARTFIKNEYGDQYSPKKAKIYAKPGAQDAHEAIRPIELSYSPEYVSKYLKKDQAQLYGLIWKRFLACQMSPAIYFQRQVLIDGGDYQFKVTGSTLIFDGFLSVYLIEDEADKKSIKIPKTLKENDPLAIKQISGKQHFTQPPPRYTEATLVKELEKQGVGRPSTYASTLSTIQNRNYVEKEKKRFSPTELGLAVNDMLCKNLPDIINVSFTAKMEEDLDKIAAGKTERDKVLLVFYQQFQKDLDKFSGEKAGKTAIKADKKCPKCKKELLIRFGKSGQFLGCEAFPECTFTANFSRDEKGNIKIIEKNEQQKSELTCPKCGKNLVEKIGKYGPFLSCPGYPECKYIHQESLDMPCPSCKNTLVKRKWRGGSFWGCSGYPKCRFSIFGQVEEKPCPKCASPYLLVSTKKADAGTLSCPNKECTYTS